MKCLVDDKYSSEKNGKIIRWKSWLRVLKKASKKDVFDSMPDQNVFFFSKDIGKCGPKTTQGDLLDWISRVVPTNSYAKMNKEISINNLAKSV